MARHDFYSQCKLHKPLDDGTGRHWIMVSWIPADKAKVGNVVRLRNSAKEQWKEGWEVMEVWGTRRYKDAAAAEQDHKNQRKTSDR